MRVANQALPSCRVVSAWLAALRVGCAALVVGVSGCGGAGNEPVAAPAQGVQPVAEPLVVGSAQSIDNGASGDPFILRVARSSSGDGFAVWVAAEGLRSSLWANRYHAATAAWGSPVRITSDVDINDLDLAVDASGIAVVVWHENPRDALPQFGRVMSARFAGTGSWTVPLPLNANSYLPRVVADRSGAALAVYAVPKDADIGTFSVRGRFLDPVSGTWQPEAAIGQDLAGSTQYNDPVAGLDGSGNALVAFVVGSDGGRTTAAGSSYFSRSGGWQPAGAIAGSSVSSPVFVQGGLDGRMELAPTTDGNFLLAWTAIDVSDTGVENAFSADIRVAEFTSRTRTWSAVRTVVSGNGQQDVTLQRMRSDASGNAHLLWTENDGMRTALKVIRLDLAGAACEAAQVIDSAVGGNAWRADLAIDPRGDAIAIWHQYEGKLPDMASPEEQSRSNIAINRFDRATASWAGAVLAETQPGDAIGPRASAAGGHALLGWIQSEGGVNRVKVGLQPMDEAPR